MSTHIGAKPGDIAKGILLPGDPLRAKYIAENFLEDPVCFNNVRGMLGYTGMYKGKRVSVMGTGMGIPSISIYATELFKDYGVENAIRIGTAGSMNTDVHIKDVVMAQGACTDSMINQSIFGGTYCPVSDFDLLRTAYKKSVALGIETRVGNVLCSDSFYQEELVCGQANAIWMKYGCLCAEMESAALMTLAKKYNARAMAMFTISDSIVAQEPELTTEEREQSLNNMISIALETICEFV